MKLVKCYVSSFGKLKDFSHLTRVSSPFSRVDGVEENEQCIVWH